MRTLAALLAAAALTAGAAEAATHEVKMLNPARVAPLEEDRRQKALQLDAARQKRLTFAQAVDRYLATKLDEFKNPKHHQQWRSTLDTCVMPHSTVAGRADYALETL